MLRSLRFAARFRFECDPQMMASMLDREISSAFVNKISKERVGDEMSKALKHRNQKYYLDLLHRTDLLPVIFQSPKSVSSLYTE